MINKESERLQVDRTQTYTAYRTTDLTQFEPHPLNRDLRPAHISWLEKEIRKVGFKQAHPIMVNPHITPGKLTIICGHHRLEAARRAGSDVWYTLTDDREPEKDRVQAWSRMDVITNYSRKGIHSYQLLTGWVAETGVSVETMLRMLSLSGGQSMYPNVDAGKLVLTPHQVSLLAQSSLMVKEVCASLKIQAKAKAHPFLFKALCMLIKYGLYDRESFIHQFSMPSTQTILQRKKVFSFDDALKRLEQMVNNRRRPPHIFLQADYERASLEALQASKFQKGKRVVKK